MLINTAREIIAILGGPQAVADLTGRGYSAVGNWQRRGFPPSTFIVLTRALKRAGHSAPASLWSMDDA